MSSCLRSDGAGFRGRDWGGRIYWYSRHLDLCLLWKIFLTSLRTGILKGKRPREHIKIYMMSVTLDRASGPNKYQAALQEFITAVESVCGSTVVKSNGELLLLCSKYLKAVFPTKPQAKATYTPTKARFLNGCQTYKLTHASGWVLYVYIIIYKSKLISWYTFIKRY